VDPRDDLDDVEKRKLLALPGLELQSLGRPACSQSLYRLRYPGSSICDNTDINSAPGSLRHVDVDGVCVCG
jgi:hypothetical protein